MVPLCTAPLHFDKEVGKGEGKTEASLSSSSAAAVVVRSATFVNGWWIAVDPSVRATTEGRKFVVSAASRALSLPPLSSSNDAMTEADIDGRARRVVPTAANERIVRCLECLAIGDAWEDGDDGPDDDGGAGYRAFEPDMCKVPASSR